MDRERFTYRISFLNVMAVIVGVGSFLMFSGMANNASEMLYALSLTLLHSVVMIYGDMRIQRKVSGRLWQNLAGVLYFGVCWFLFFAAVEGIDIIDYHLDFDGLNP